LQRAQSLRFVERIASFDCGTREDAMEFGAGGELTGLFASACPSATLLPGICEGVIAPIPALGKALIPSAAFVAMTGKPPGGSPANWAVGHFSAFRDQLRDILGNARRRRRDGMRANHGRRDRGLRVV
jgi:membrane protein YqaA with SNARE-associated domain